MSAELDKPQSDETEELGPTSERWDPLGADNEADSILVNYETDPYVQMCTSGNGIDPNRIRSLEEEQEMLTTSLMALTSHFAQVQFRLRQIVDAPISQRDQLLKNLEEFAFRGIPEITGNTESEEVITNLERARQRQFELIDRLKRQLTELEKFAYESGAPVLPQSILVEKQKMIIDELKNKLNLNVNETDLPQLSSEDIRNQVDSAIGEFVGPLKMKEQLVAQLKTQIADLERFIAFLQCDSEEIKLKPTEQKSDAYNSYAAKKKHSTETLHSSFNPNITASKFDKHSKEFGHHSSMANNEPGKNDPEAFNSKAYNLMDKASTLLQMFAVAQFGCGSNRFQKNTLKRSSKVNHWGDLRAQLEVDIQEVASLAITMKRDREKHVASSSSNTEPYDVSTSDSDNDDEINIEKGATAIRMERFSLTNVELTSTVRRNFAVTLQKLMQHGLRNEIDTTSTLVPFIGCFNNVNMRSTNSYTQDDDEEHFTNNNGQRQMHAWELILEYYNIKNGEKYNETPARKLSQSFNLDIVGGNAISNKQSLLSVIGSIIAMHHPYKRSYNSHFKAFVCAGLNSHKLVCWLNLIFQCSDLVNTYYTTWSYAARTGFRDALRSIDCLTKHDFDLPVDLAIRQFQNIRDVFM